MPDYRETTQKLKAHTRALRRGHSVVYGGGNVWLDTVAGDIEAGLALLTEQDAELATLRAENARLHKTIDEKLTAIEALYLATLDRQAARESR